MEKLISMVDYCQLVSKEFMMPKKPFDKNEWFVKILNYSDFLKKPLTLNMFIPCCENGFLLKEPEWWYRYQNGASPFMNMDEIRPCQEYKKALENVLFLGRFDVKAEGNPFVRLNNIEFHLHGLTIERLVTFQLQLSQSVIKQFWS